MACRGVLFAINSEQEKRLKACKNDTELVAYIVENIEEPWEEEFLCETDKAWDAIHRCFADGEMELFGGKKPLNSIIFGGEILNSESDYYVSLKSHKLVKDIANKITSITPEQLRKLYDTITDNYQGEKTDEDFEYTLEWFKSLQVYYPKMALTKRSVIFTVDQ